MAVARNGYPIRLIQDNGNIIELTATRIDMNVTRKTGGKPMPFTGSSRYSLDMNINSAMITIQGVFVDDHIPTGGELSSSTINFARIRSPPDDFIPGRSEGGVIHGILHGHRGHSGWYGTGANLQYYFSDEAQTGDSINSEKSTMNRGTLPAGRYFTPSASNPTNINVVAKAFSLKTLAGDVPNSNNGYFDIYYKSFSGDGGRDTTQYLSGETNPTIRIDLTGNHLQSVHNEWYDVGGNYKGVTPTSLATAFANCINQHSHLSPYFTATVKSVSDWGGEKYNAGVKVTQKTSGVAKGGFIGTSFSVTNKQGPPYVSLPSGGKDAVRKSAGDKVQDIWGVVNNSIPSAKGSPLRTNINIFSGRQEPAKGDYIVGLQLPYNSLVQAGASEEYVARNFLVPVGRFKHGIVEGGPNNPFGNKGSEENNEPANVEFSKSGFTSGIQGTVTKFDVSYDAGENVYVYTMIFAPINRMG